MSLETVKAFFSSNNALDRVIELTESSATVELAATALGCLPAHIAKTMSFEIGDETVLVVCAGDARIDNRKFRAEFASKAKMVPADRVEKSVGHAVGGVCPFAVREGVKTYLDISLKRFETVYPAAGNASSAVRLSIGELETYSNHQGWVDVCRNWQE